MRYRPVGASGAAVSSLCLELGDAQFARGPTALKDLIFAALEMGINAYHLEHSDPILLQTVGEALSHVERHLVWVNLTLGTVPGKGSDQRDFAPDRLTRTVEEALHSSGLGWFDVAVLNEPADDELPVSALQALKALRSSGQVRLLGVRGDDPVMDAYVSTGAFDALFTPYSVEVDWQIRNRMRTAQKRDMSIFIYDYDRDVRRDKRRATADAPRRRGFLGLGRRTEEAKQPDRSRYEFLHQTKGWTAEELALGICLTEPSIASALIQVKDLEHLSELATVPDRDLSAGINAQIEMARVG